MSITFDLIEATAKHSVICFEIKDGYAFISFKKKLKDISETIMKLQGIIKAENIEDLSRT